MSGLKEEAIYLLKNLIKVPSISKKEENTADLLTHYITNSGFTVSRHLNNIWVYPPGYDVSKPSVLLNSHHDTVPPAKGYSHDPFLPIEKDGKIFGLGSNDAGGALVSYWLTFKELAKKNLPFNLIFAATAEEEISGQHGMASILDKMGPLAFALIGEPTGMNAAVAEKGLMVLDCYSAGIAGHAARNEGVNAIYKALPDIHWFSSFQFPKVSHYLGPIKMSVTMLDAGKKHNVVPEECHFVVDVRSTDAYTHDEVLDIISLHTSCKVKPRSTRLKPSGLEHNHPMLGYLKASGVETYGSPTLSDQALLSVPSIKIGPGESSRSHTPDEFIKIAEIEAGISKLLSILENMSISEITPKKGGHPYEQAMGRPF